MYGVAIFKCVLERSRDIADKDTTSDNWRLVRLATDKWSVVKKLLRHISQQYHCLRRLMLQSTNHCHFQPAIFNIRVGNMPAKSARQ